MDDAGSFRRLLKNWNHLSRQLRHPRDERRAGPCDHGAVDTSPLNDSLTGHAGSAERRGAAVAVRRPTLVRRVLSILHDRAITTSELLRANALPTMDARKPLMPSWPIRRRPTTCWATATGSTLSRRWSHASMPCLSWRISMRTKGANLSPPCAAILQKWPERA